MPHWTIEECQKYNIIILIYLSNSYNDNKHFTSNNYFKSNLSRNMNKTVLVISQSCGIISIMMMII